MPVLENGARCGCETIAHLAPVSPLSPPISRFPPSQGQAFEPCALARPNSLARHRSPATLATR
ncbi:hypothetical protein [Microcoleus sp.]|uniref:hypothetical protein n=1 Tax=Microcoleus sp. TaxID=44472 RepID=UPI00403EDF5E